MKVYFPVDANGSMYHIGGGKTYVSTNKAKAEAFLRTINAEAIERIKQDHTRLHGLAIQWQDIVETYPDLDPAFNSNVRAHVFRQDLHLYAQPWDEGAHIDPHTLPWRLAEQELEE